MSNEIEDIYKRLITLPCVCGFVVLNADGLAIKSSLGAEETLKYVGLVAPLVDKARKTVRDFAADEEDNEDDIEFLRIRTRLYEILIAPEGDYIMVAIQLPYGHEDQARVRGAEEQSHTSNTN